MSCCWKNCRCCWDASDATNDAGKNAALTRPFWFVCSLFAGRPRPLLSPLISMLVYKKVVRAPNTQNFIGRRSFDSWMTRSSRNKLVGDDEEEVRVSKQAGLLDASANNGFVHGFIRLFATKSTRNTSNTGQNIFQKESIFRHFELGRSWAKYIQPNLVKRNTYN